MNSTEQATIRAWKVKYQGDMHELLYDMISKMDWKEGGNSAPIIQSTGTGKSRMVHEMATLAFTIPLNLDVRPEELHCHPLRDVRIRLTVFHDAENVLLQELNFLRFFTSVFRRVERELSAFPTQETHAKLALAWRTHLDVDGCRKSLYADILLNFLKSSWNDGVSELNTTREEAIAALSSLLKTIDSKATEKLPEQYPKLIVYFDGAEFLVDTTIGISSWNMYDVLCSAIHSFSGQSLFGIFLSTTPTRRNYKPTVRYDGVIDAPPTYPSQDPITMTPFDCSPKLPISESKVTLKDVSTEEFMAQLGRPLYWSLLDAGLFPSWLIDRVCERFLNGQTMDRIGWWDNDLKLALLDIQLTLGYAADPAPQHKEASLIGKHMRIAYQINRAQDFVFSGYSSEPILDEAAARLIHHIDRRDSEMGAWESGCSWDLELIAYGKRTGLLDHGQMSGLIGRRLLTRAYMTAVLTPTRPTMPRFAGFSGGVRLVDFLKGLIAKGFIADVLSCTSNLDDVPLKKAFKEAYVRFTHWIKVIDDTITAAVATAAFLRCAAIIHDVKRSPINLLIPVLMWDTEISHWVTSGILIKIKRRQSAGVICLSEIDEREIGFFPKKSKIPDEFAFELTTSRPHPNLRPYISLVMELGRESSLPYQAEDHKESTKLYRPSSIFVSSSGPLFATKEIHPRYNIFIYGYTGASYSVAGHEAKRLYDRILGGDDLSDHPRQDAASLQAVKTMRPGFFGMDSSQWLKSSLPDEKPVDDSEIAGVFTGPFDGDAVQRFAEDLMSSEEEDATDSESVS